VVSIAGFPVNPGVLSAQRRQRTKR
jgi:hypothetical protein